MRNTVCEVLTIFDEHYIKACLIHIFRKVSVRKKDIYLLVFRWDLFASLRIASSVLACFNTQLRKNYGIRTIYRFSTILL